MSPRLGLLPSGCEELYTGYITRIKNTFIDITPKEARQRSHSCFAKFEPSCPPPATRIKRRASLEGEEKHPDEVHPAKFPLRARSSTCSTIGDGSEFVLAASLTLTSPRCSNESSEVSVPGQGMEEFIEEQIQKYLVNTDNSGRTLMWHGMSTKSQVDPHLIGILDAIQAKDVGYIYLPQNIWEKKGKPIDKCRNKGYAFIHFLTEVAASDFAEKLYVYCGEKAGLAETTHAVHQGISTNLRALLSAPQKRTNAASIFLPNRNNRFERVPIQALRDVLGKMPSSANCTEGRSSQFGRLSIPQSEFFTHQ